MPHPLSCRVVAAVAALLAVPLSLHAAKRLTAEEAIAKIRAAEEACSRAASADERTRIWKALVKDLKSARIQAEHVPIWGFISWLKWTMEDPDEGRCAPAPGVVSKFSREQVVNARHEMFDLPPDAIGSVELDRARRSSIGVTARQVFEGEPFQWLLVSPPWAVREPGGPAALLQQGREISFDCYPVVVSRSSLLCKVPGIDARSR